ncbi:MAG: hypothetical protein FWC64_08590 [Treponema sp.]|nr:hypothetical protein [Treponema sp.]
MLNNEASVVMLSRLLTPENKAQLLAWVRLAYAAENSARKAQHSVSALDGAFTQEAQEYSCIRIEAQK